MRRDCVETVLRGLWRSGDPYLSLASVASEVAACDPYFRYLRAVTPDRSNALTLVMNFWFILRLRLAPRIPRTVGLDLAAFGKGVDFAFDCLYA